MTQVPPPSFKSVHFSPVDIFIEEALPIIQSSYPLDLSTTEREDSPLPAPHLSPSTRVFSRYLNLLSTHPQNDSPAKALRDGLILQEISLEDLSRFATELQDLPQDDTLHLYRSLSEQERIEAIEIIRQEIFYAQEAASLSPYSLWWEDIARNPLLGHAFHRFLVSQKEYHSVGLLQVYRELSNYRHGEGSREEACRLFHTYFANIASSPLFVLSSLPSFETFCITISTALETPGGDLSKLYNQIRVLIAYYFNTHYLSLSANSPFIVSPSYTDLATAVLALPASDLAQRLPLHEDSDSQALNEEIGFALKRQKIASSSSREEYDPEEWHQSFLKTLLQTIQEHEALLKLFPIRGNDRLADAELFVWLALERVPPTALIRETCRKALATLHGCLSKSGSTTPLWKEVYAALYRLSSPAIQAAAMLDRFTIAMQLKSIEYDQPIIFDILKKYVLGEAFTECLFELNTQKAFLDYQKTAHRLLSASQQIKKLLLCHFHWEEQDKSTSVPSWNIRISEIYRSLIIDGNIILNSLKIEDKGDRRYLVKEPAMHSDTAESRIQRQHLYLTHLFTSLQAVCPEALGGYEPSAFALHILAKIKEEATGTYNEKTMECSIDYDSLWAEGYELREDFPILNALIALTINSWSQVEMRLRRALPGLYDKQSYASIKWVDTGRHGTVRVGEDPTDWEASLQMALIITSVDPQYPAAVTLSLESSVHPLPGSNQKKWQGALRFLDFHSSPDTSPEGMLKILGLLQQLHGAWLMPNSEWQEPSFLDSPSKDRHIPWTLRLALSREEAASSMETPSSELRIEEEGRKRGFRKHIIRRRTASTSRVYIPLVQQQKNAQSEKALVRRELFASFDKASSIIYFVNNYNGIGEQIISPRDQTLHYQLAQLYPPAVLEASKKSIEILLSSDRSPNHDKDTILSIESPPEHFSQETKQQAVAIIEKTLYWQSQLQTTYLRGISLSDILLDKFLLATFSSYLQSIQQPFSNILSTATPTDTVLFKLLRTLRDYFTTTSAEEAKSLWAEITSQVEKIDEEDTPCLKDALSPLQRAIFNENASKNKDEAARHLENALYGYLSLVHLNSITGNAFFNSGQFTAIASTALMLPLELAVDEASDDKDALSPRSIDTPRKDFLKICKSRITHFPSNNTTVIREEWSQHTRDLLDLCIRYYPYLKIIYGDSTPLPISLDIFRGCILESLIEKTGLGIRLRRAGEIFAGLIHEGVSLPGDLKETLSSYARLIATEVRRGRRLSITDIYVYLKDKKNTSLKKFLIKNIIGKECWQLIKELYRQDGKMRKTLEGLITDSLSKLTD